MRARSIGVATATTTGRRRGKERPPDARSWDEALSDEGGAEALLAVTVPNRSIGVADTDSWLLRFTYARDRDGRRTSPGGPPTKRTALRRREPQRA